MDSTAFHIAKSQPKDDKKPYLQFINNAKFPCLTAKVTDTKTEVQFNFIKIVALITNLKLTE